MADKKIARHMTVIAIVTLLNHAGEALNAVDAAERYVNEVLAPIVRFLVDSPAAPQPRRVHQPGASVSILDALAAWLRRITRPAAALSTP